MGVFEWALLGGAYTVILAVFFTVLALEIKKTKQFKEQASNAILSSTMRWSTRITLIVLSALIVIGGPITVIVCSTVDPAPQGAYVFLMIVFVLGGLLCLFCVLGSFFNRVCATEEGVWVRHIGSQSKFYRYPEIVYARCGRFGRMSYSKAGGAEIFAIAKGRDTNAVKMVNLIEEHCPYLPNYDNS